MQPTTRRPGPTSTEASSAGEGQRAIPRRAVAFLPLHGVFGPTSAWRLDVRGAPENRASAAMVANLTSQVSDHWNGVAAVNSRSYNVRYYTVSRATRRTTVLFDDCQHKGSVPSQLYTKAGGAQFRSVPIPPGARASAGTDGELGIWSPATDQLWEFWRVHRAGDRWYACWGGRIDHASKSPGFFRRGMGATATGLAMAGGIVRAREIRAGHIDHAISLSVIDAARGSLVSYPAQRSDGDDRSADAIPEGIRFRLDPSVDVDSLPLSRFAKMVAHAAQRYGFIVVDRSGAVALTAETTRFFPASQTSHALAGFPWSRLQALPTDYGRR